MIIKHNSMNGYTLRGTKGDISPRKTAWLPGPCYLAILLPIAIIDLTWVQNSVDMFIM